MTITTARVALVLVATAALSATASAAAEPSRPLDATAKRVSDAYVRALALKHDPTAAKRYSSARIEQLRQLSAAFANDGIQTLVGRSRILRDCRASLRDKPSARGDCVHYHLRGIRRVGGREKRTDGELDIWLRREAGAWKVWSFDYVAQETVCATKCRP